MNYLILVLIPLVLALWAQAKVITTYNRWSKVNSRGHITGAEAASAIMQAAGIYDVEIKETSGNLTDHYDPQNRCLVLSSNNYHSTTLAALGVSAHEAGHALQHKEQYAPLNLRMTLIPITNFSAQLLPVVMFGGFIFPAFGYKLIALGALIYSVLTVFQLVTLPVEFDASRRAKLQLVNLGILDQDELKGVSQTLDAAAFTYIAAFVSSLGWLLRFISILNNNKD
jgi:Zn-dependent membrane protease YugP